MVYSYVTHSKQGHYYTITFSNDMEPDSDLVVRFLPTTDLPFAKGNIELQLMKLRDPELILYTLEQHGLTIILKGI